MKPVHWRASARRDLDDAAACVPMLNRLLDAAAHPVHVAEHVLQVSASLGLTFYPQADDADADQLLRQADQAMYQAKLSGKNRFHVFDAAVNSGRGNAARWLQAAVGTAQDGRIGPVTLAAVASLNPAALVARYSAVRLKFMTDLSTWPSFGRGWARRIAANLMETI